ncbi:xanthine dehydrogenase [Amyelois transitella]|uniref:xanthine dehydrogenase n=1 Tax=Amyelois transitella TaxID=680683 RepID=UPI00298F4626|nr:xanthine dehydrogenase [Amyelois transitella]
MSQIIFTINGKQYTADGKYGPDMSLNEYIRTIADLRGTKVMCREGGCGACVVAVRAPLPPSNECLVSVLSCHGWEILTAEGIGNRTLGYHEIQSRLANFNGTQCGYCTPGWIMNMYSLYESKNKKLTMTEVENSFASNICRCTGYRSIADAFKTFATDVSEDLKCKMIDMEDLSVLKPCGVKCKEKCAHTRNKNINRNEEVEEEWCVLAKENNKMIVIDGETHKWFKAYALDDVFKAINENDDYKLIAGNTGQGVFHVTHYPHNVIDIFNVAEIKGYEIDENLILGAGMPLSEMMDVFLKLSSENEDFSYLKQFYDHMDLVAHIPVRNIGTIGGNLFMKYTNNDFQSDVFLLFETVGAAIKIAESGDKSSTMSLLEFLRYDMTKKVITHVLLPPLSHCCSVKTYKIMPRSQNAHAVVNAGVMFKFKRDPNLLEKASIVYGSISPKFVHAFKTEAALVGKDPYTEENLQLALRTLKREIMAEEAPPEPSAEYRKMLALALYYKAILSFCPNDRLNPKYRSGGEVIKRNTSKGTQVFDTDKSIWPLNQPVPKLEALVQCSGESVFANDLPTQTGEVYAAFVTADVNPGSVVKAFDPEEAFKIPGVVAFYTAKDIPGKNSFMAPNPPLVTMDEEILCDGKVKFYGQPVGIIVADRERTANKAASAVKIKYASINRNRPLIMIEDVLKSPQRCKRVTVDEKVQPKDKGNDVKCVLYGDYKIGTQYHYTMETQTCVVQPTEDGLEVYSATQWLDLTNVAVAQCLNVNVNSVNVVVRRVGGGYGSKISRASQVACAASLVTHLLGKTCRFVLPLETNVKIIGKRLPTYCQFEVGVNKEGEIQYLKNKYYQDNGCAKNEVITGITLHHFLNCYDSSRWYIEANSVYTDTPSNTWCRAPSSTEGLAMIEYIMERIAFNLGKDPLQVRLLNMAKKDNPIPGLIDQLKFDANYDARLQEVKAFNDRNRWRKRAIKLIPMTYDLFYIGPFATLVSIFHADGSVIVNHGGIEMGQGINTKVAQVTAYKLGIPLEKVSVKPTSSFTSPNSMATGASVGSECVCYAITKACDELLQRLEPIKSKMRNPTWEQLITEAYNSGVNLQSSQIYSTSDEKVKTYFIYGVVIMEVEVDILTGNHDILRVDLLEDTGRSLSPLIDVGQIEGAFIMGLGYWTSENQITDLNTGRILTDRTWTYKPPGIKDIPADFRVYFRRNYGNPYGVLQSKATGEPSLCMAVVITHALREAIRLSRLDAGYQDQWVDIKNPCTVENIFMAAGHRTEHFTLKYPGCILATLKRSQGMQLPKHLKIAAGSGGAAIFGILFGWVIFPTVLKSQLKKEMALTKKTDVRQMWQKIPFALDFKVYLFNYTNAEEVHKGAIPIVKEIGPYYFEEWKEKVEVEDHEEDDTITYKKLDVFYFRPELSGPGLTGEELIVMPHVFMLAVATVISRDKPAMLNMIGKAFNGVFDDPPDMFLRVKAMDILFRGVVINCARTEFAPKAFCTALKKENVAGLTFEPNNQLRFSLFAARNGTVDPHVVTVKRGKTNVMDVGKVVAVDGKPQQEIWKDSCNEYQGTDGTVFPPFLTENDRLQSFSGDLCRSFKPWYQKKTSYQGIKTNRYVANIGDFANDPELQCFCDSPDTCPPKGLMDLMKCMSAPMYASLPHFLDSDPELLKNIKGLNPDPNEHSIAIDFEPISGTPMVARQRVQFNMLLLQNEKLELCKTMPNTIAPLFWIEEGLALNKTFVKMLKNQLFLPKRAVGVLRWLLVAFGTLGVIGSLIFHFKDRIMKFAVSSGSTPAAKINPEQGKDISVIGQPQDPPKVDM